MIRLYPNRSKSFSIACTALRNAQQRLMKEHDPAQFLPPPSGPSPSGSSCKRTAKRTKTAACSSGGSAGSAACGVGGRSEVPAGEDLPVSPHGSDAAGLSHVRNPSKASDSAGLSQVQASDMAGLPHVRDTAGLPHVRKTWVMLLDCDTLWFQAADLPASLGCGIGSKRMSQGMQYHTAHDRVQHRMQHFLLHLGSPATYLTLVRLLSPGCLRSTF